MMFSRRRFICGATASTLVLPSLMGMLSAKASAASDTILVILNMQGGNDGYGMIQPITQATYGQYPTFTQASLDSNGNFVVAVDFRDLLSQVVANFGADPQEFFPEYGANDADARIYAYSQHAVAGLFKA